MLERLIGQLSRGVHFAFAISYHWHTTVFPSDARIVMSLDSTSLPNSPSWPADSWIGNLFGFKATVNQRHYVYFGVGLMLIKYCVEAIVIAILSGHLYTPLDFVNPLVSSRERFTAHSPLWLGMGWVLWTLPFLWIAISMSIRRAAYVGYSP